MIVIGDNYKVIYVDLPTECRGLVVTDGDDFYTIVLNSRLSHDGNIKTFKHELKHIERNDFDSFLSVGMIEKNM